MTSKMFSPDDSLETVRTTIVGGRPPETVKLTQKIPRGLEVLIKKAALDEDFKKLLLSDHSLAAREIGLVLEESEIEMLNAIGPKHLEMMIACTTVPEKQKKAFLGKAAAAMLAALTAVGFTQTEIRAESEITKGIRPDEPALVESIPVPVQGPPMMAPGGALADEPEASGPLSEPQSADSSSEETRSMPDTKLSDTAEKNSHMAILLVSQENKQSRDEKEPFPANSPENMRITIDVRSKKVSEVMAELEKVTGYRFIINRDLRNRYSEKYITVFAEKCLLKDFLRSLYGRDVMLFTTGNKIIRIEKSRFENDSITRGIRPDLDGLMGE